jgi:mono/diheme cytochrome c family protein
MNRSLQVKYIIVLTLMLVGLVLVGCGRRPLPSQDAPAGATPTTAATPLSAEFKQPTTIIQKEAEKTAAEASTPTPLPAAGADLSRGERTYTTKGCADCHGAQGEGVEGKGNPLAGAPLTEVEFNDILRSGGDGKLGNEHLYGPQSISPSAMKALYEYVKSFPAP